ncbi:MAG: secretin N-terminal domain-containing protein [Alphaproteobacteria bacterium]|nr:secretin N-terminal domain-containing protein [Alphaproteobacteria bacterium]MDI9329852.1 secretin N-terminal domain-containing protein [Alphaproteobacteria bacterium]
MKRVVVMGALWVTGSAVGAQSVPFDIDFHAIDTASALRVLAHQSGINLVLTEGVKGSVSLQLHQTDGLSAMRALAQARGLVLVSQDQVWWVGTQAEWLVQEKGRQEVLALQLLRQELVLRSYRLHHGRALDWLDQLQGRAVHADTASRLSGAGVATGGARAGASSSRWLSPRGQAMADSRTNHLVVLDTAEVQERIAQWVAQLDVPQRQVQIEARIVEATEGFGQSLGARLQTPGDRWALDWSAVPLSGLSPARAALSLLGPGQTGRVWAEISALQERGQGKLVATPSLITADQTRAIIEQGTELPYQVGSSAGNSHTIAFRKAELRLDVVPQITPEGEIHLDLDLRRDSVGELTGNGYAIDTKRLQTQVRVPDGGTLIIGGIYIDDHNDQRHQIPGLTEGWLGRLFGRTQQRRQRQELLIFITPKMLPIGPTHAGAP